MFEPTTNTLRNTKFQFSYPFTQNKNLHWLVLQQDKLFKQVIAVTALCRQQSHCNSRCHWSVVLGQWIVFRDW